MDNNILDRIIAILAKQTGGDATALTAQTSLEEVGIDSFDFIEFVFFIEDEFDIKIEANYNDLGVRLKTIGDVATAVDALVREKSSAAVILSGVAVPV